MTTPGHKNIPVDLFGLALCHAKKGKTKMLGLSQNISDTRLIVWKGSYYQVFSWHKCFAYIVAIEYFRIDGLISNFPYTKLK